jgi:tellurite resistance protein TerC
MYFMLGDVVHRYAYIKYGLAVVLVFIGGKMLLTDLYHVPTLISLVVVASAITGSIGFSILRARAAEPESAEITPAIVFRRTGTR